MPCVTIGRIGADGDGIAILADGTPFYLPETLPGERVRARPLARRGEGWAGAADAVLAPSAERIVAPCPHFGACGGCTLQHWRDDAYAGWKRGLLVAALARAGFPDVPVAALVRTLPGTRRRADLAIRRLPSGISLGLHARGAADVVDLAVCPVLHPSLAALLGPLRAALGGLRALRAQGSAVLNLLDTGPDLLLRTDAEPGVADRAALACVGATYGLPRIAWAPARGPAEVVAQHGPATIALSGVVVAPPPGAFLQASREGEAAIVAGVLAGLPQDGRTPVIDLYAGIGTLSLAIATRRRVVAFEGDAAAIAALRRAGGWVTATQRDLARRPLLPAELAGAAAVVLDPPFAGAAAQMPAIAASGVACVVYVSCNPATLARDARVLREAGFAAAAATPIDQFLWSARLESVVVFVRSRTRVASAARVR